jgi:hypothetical protein
MRKERPMRKIIFASITVLAVLIFNGTTQAAKTPAYVGVSGCNCHKAEVEEWKGSPHSRAFELLMAKDRSKSHNKAMAAAKLDYKKDFNTDEKCLKCHTTGSGQPGGYVNDKNKAELGFVGCEMCHGAGGDYAGIHDKKAKTYTHAETVAAGQLYPQEGEKVCRQCHDNPDSPFNSKLDAKYLFNYTEMIKLNKAWHITYPLKGKH